MGGHPACSYNSQPHYGLRPAMFSSKRLAIFSREYYQADWYSTSMPRVLDATCLSPLSLSAGTTARLTFPLCLWSRDRVPLRPTASHCVSPGVDSISIRLHLSMIIAVIGLATSRMKERVAATDVRRLLFILLTAGLTTYATFRIIFWLDCRSVGH